MAQDLSSVRDLVKDEQAIVLLAHVALHDGETSHHYITDEGHVAVTVKTHKHGVPIDALLPGGADGGTGPWWIPEIGTEVAIGFDGDFEGDAFVIAIYGSAPPAQMDEAKLVLVGTEIHAIAPNGTAHALALKSDVDATNAYLDMQFDPTKGHTHKAVVPADPTPLVPSVVPGVGASGAPTAQGTTVLKGQ